MEKIDLHQDIILSYKNDTESFFSYTSSYEDKFGVDAGNYDSYIGAELKIVIAVIWPYRIGFGDKVNEVIYDEVIINEGVLWYSNLNQKKGLRIFKDSSLLAKSISNENLNFILHVEGFDNCTSILDIQNLYSSGIRSLGFAWNFDNFLSGCNTTGNALKKLGFEAVEYMNSIGMLIDTAHMSHEAMMSVVKHSKKPIINSHSNCMSLCKNTRNVEDSFLKEMVKNGGVLGLSLCSDFIAGDGKPADIEMYIEQIKYIRNLIGDDFIGFGSDYHGLIQGKETVEGFGKIAALSNLEELINGEFGSSFCKKFFFDNSFRVFKDVFQLP